VQVQRPLGPADRVRLAPAATRTLGSDLYVNVGGATASVKCLTGSGPELWYAFEAGMTIAEVTQQQVLRTGAPSADVEAHVVQFAASLIDAGLATPA
jgi:hypothetical protein